MGSRGRKSADELATAPFAVLETRRPAPPQALCAEERAIWRDTVACMPAGWFNRSHYPLLIGFCRHAARADALAAQIAAFKPEWIKQDGGLGRLDKLMAMAERETRALMACARSLRLTKQSQIEPRSAGVATGKSSDVSTLWEGAKPWDPQPFRRGPR